MALVGDNKLQPIQRLLSDISVAKGKAYVPDATIFLDRGSMTTKISQEILNACADFFCTSKRQEDVCFTYGSQRPDFDADKQIVIPKKGARSLYWATKLMESPYGKFTIRCFAGRSGTGKVVIITSSLPISPYDYFLKFRKPNKKLEWLKEFYCNTKWYKIIPSVEYIDVDAEMENLSDVDVPAVADDVNIARACQDGPVDHDAMNNAPHGTLDADDGDVMNNALHGTIDGDAMCNDPAEVPDIYLLTNVAGTNNRLGEGDLANADTGSEDTHIGNALNNSVDAMEVSNSEEIHQHPPHDDGLYRHASDDVSIHDDNIQNIPTPEVISTCFSRSVKNLKLLTLSQGDAIWHILRKFAITGRTSVNLLKYLAKNYTFLDTVGFDTEFIADVDTVLDFLCLKKTLITQIIDQPWYRHGITAKELQDLKYKKADLQGFCERAGLTKSHNIPTLCRMLVSAAPVLPDPVLQCLLKGWFMVPLKDKSSLYDGLRNEDNVLSWLPDFTKDLVANHRFPFTVLESRQIGLVGKLDEDFVRVSPDAISCVLIHGHLEMVSTEIKTKTKEKTVGKAKQDARQLGKFRIVSLADDFKKYVPDLNDRSQLLHQRYTLQCATNASLYVVASLEQVLRLVAFCPHSDILLAYGRILKGVLLQIPWILGTSDLELPDFIGLEFGEEKDAHTLRQYFRLSRALKKMINDDGPLPPASSFIAAIIDKWNAM